MPVAGGAWTNASSTRSIIMPSPTHINSQMVHPNNTRLEEPDRGFERPPPKGNAELFNPKNARRSNSGNNRSNSSSQDKAEIERDSGGDVVANMIDRVASLSVGDAGPGSPSPVKAAIVMAMST